MFAYFVRRLLLVIPTFIGVTLVAFGITRLVPGGPLDKMLMEMKMGGNRGVMAEAGQIPERAIAELQKAFDLDKPWYIAYFHWLRKVAVFDFGRSYNLREPVSRLILDRFPISIYFGLIGFVLSYLVCVPLGILKALKHGSTFDFASSAVVFLGYSIPGWALGALLLVLLAGGRFYSVFPLGGFRSQSFDELPSMVRQAENREAVEDEFGSFQWDKLSFSSKVIDQGYHTILPIFCYMIGSFATLTVLMKNSILENLGQDYVRTAFAKGLSPTRVMLVHVLRNSLIPLATGLGHALGIVMAGSYLIEFVFNIPGLGMLGYTSIVARDYTVVMGILAINTLITLTGNIISDLLYAVIDPRIRFN